MIFFFTVLGGHFKYVRLILGELFLDGKRLTFPLSLNGGGDREINSSPKNLTQASNFN
ncbi:MAG: hypothetical protein L6Q54_09770 [Leptospiraceae bacterium]|nr:hypothetical protein [Leptospiraceae bacterium]NUM42612.1 hypothetical protein [Leptospiraceae bacterium]